MRKKIIIVFIMTIIEKKYKMGSGLIESLLTLRLQQ